MRCAWCKKRHNRDTLFAGDHSRIPFFDDVSLGFVPLMNESC